MRFLVIIFLLFSLSMTSQIKFEREYKIDANKVPKNALKTINSWHFKKKVRWYAEESQDGKTFEAKVCYQSKKHSIEFTENGEIIDAEVKVKFSELAQDVKLQIQKVLNEKFKKFKIKKTQIQHTGNAQQIYSTVFNISQSQLPFKPNYELIVVAKKDKVNKGYEFLFNSKGEVIKELIIAPQNNDNLEF